MATATKKKPPAAKKAQAKAKPRAVAKRSTQAAAPVADDEAPDRSAPQLAEVDADALEFIEAIDRFKKQHGRPFPSWSEVLLVLRQLGYKRR